MDQNPYASPTASDAPEASRADERARLPRGRVFLPLLLAPVVTATALLFSLWLFVSIGQVWPDSEFPDSYPPLEEVAKVTGWFAGISLAFAAVLAAPLLYWLWRSHRLSSKLLTIITLGLLVASFGLFAFMAYWLAPEIPSDPSTIVLGMFILFVLPYLAPCALYIGWIYWLERSSSVNQD